MKELPHEHRSCCVHTYKHWRYSPHTQQHPQTLSHSVHIQTHSCTNWHIEPVFTSHLPEDTPSPFYLWSLSQLYKACVCLPWARCWPLTEQCCVHLIPHGLAFSSLQLTFLTANISDLSRTIQKDWLYIILLEMRVNYENSCDAAAACVCLKDFISYFEQQKQLETAVLWGGTATSVIFHFNCIV